MRQASRKADNEEPIPMQRNAIRRFVAARPDWELTTEFVEEGVSAFKNSSKDRDILQDVLRKAGQRAFDVLLVFKADRLSRQSFEYPFILSALSRVGVKVFSVADEIGGKELKVEGQYDKLLRFLEGWQAETESSNTSIRVSEKMRQIAEKGLWTGGKAPYGYRYEKRANSPIPLVREPEEAAFIVKVFELYLDRNLGTPTIAYRLNQEGCRQRNGKPWMDSMIRRVMQNPVVTGRLAYGRTQRGHGKSRTRLGSHNLEGVILSDPYPELVIVSQDRWEAAMRKMQSYNAPAAPNPGGLATRFSRADSSVLLFTGLARCAHCGGPLVSFTVNSNYKTVTNGERVHYSRPVYRCQTRVTRGKHLCDGQTTYSAKKVESALLSAIKETLSHLDAQTIIDEVRHQAEQSLWSKTTRHDLLKRQVQDTETLHKAWLERLDKFFLNPSQSMYSEEVLAAKVREAGDRLMALRQEIEMLVAVQTDLNEQKRSLEAFLAGATEWWEKFLVSPHPEQKALLKQIVDKVVVGRDGYNISWKVTLEALAEGGTGALRWQQSEVWPSVQRA